MRGAVLSPPNGRGAVPACKRDSEGVPGLMAHETTVTGVLVAWNERAYQSFQRGGETMPGGVTRKCWIVTDPATEPAVVKLRDVSDFQTVAEAGFGAHVRVDCELYANGSRIDPVAKVGGVMVDKAGAARKAS